MLVLVALVPGVASAHAPMPPYRVVWSLEMPTAVGAPVLEGDTAIVVGRDAVIGVDTTAGTIAWSVPRSGGPLIRPALGYSDSVAVLVYIENAEAVSGAPSPSPGAARPSDLVALDLETRSEMWRVTFDEGLPGGVSAWGTNAYAVDGSGRLTAVSLADGSESWNAPSVGVGDAPAVGAGTEIYVAGRGDGPARISAFDATTGERLWAKSPVSGAPNTSALAVSGETVAYIGSDRIARVLDRTDGEERWTALLMNLPSPVGTPVVSDDEVYFVDFMGGVYRFDATTGAEVWSFQLNDLVVRSSPVLTETALVVGTNGGRVTAIDRASGHLISDLDTGEGLIGGFVVPESLLVVNRGGADPAVIAVSTDAATPLLDVASPTELDLASTLGRFAFAFVAVLAVLTVPPRLFALWRRRTRDDVPPVAPRGGSDGPGEAP